MRNPLNPGVSATVYFYVGGYPISSIWGGQIKYRFGTSGDWSSATLGWDSNNGSNDYWKASFVTPASPSTIQYYAVLNGAPGYDVTYLYNNNVKTGNETLAAAAPYSFTTAK